MRPSTASRLAACLTALAVGLGGGQASAQITYRVTVNTSAASDVPGSVVFQFNPGGPGAQPATATVSNFQSTRLTAGAVTTEGSVTGGALQTGPVGFTNAIVPSTNGNIYIQDFTFGTGAGAVSGYQFDVTLAGPAVTAPDGTATTGTNFFIGAFDANGPLVPTADQGGYLARLDITPGSGVVLAVNDSPVFVTLTPVPEPAALLTVAVTGLAAWYRRRTLLAPALTTSPRVNRTCA